MLCSKSPLKSHAHSAEQVHDQQDDHDQPDNPYPSARPPSPISVIASAAPEQEHQDKNQQDQSHGNFLSATAWLRSRGRRPSGVSWRNDSMALGGKGQLPGGQTAKARPGSRVQSLQNGHAATRSIKSKHDPNRAQYKCLSRCRQLVEGPSF